MADGHTNPAQLGPQATKLAAAGWVQIDGAWFDPAKPHLPGVLADYPSPDLDWSDYEASRPDRCSPDLMARRAASAARNRDGF